jgi:hypothetical protein
VHTFTLPPAAPTPAAPTCATGPSAAQSPLDSGLAAPMSESARHHWLWHAVSHGPSRVAQFIAVCRRSKSGSMGTRRHPRGSPLYTRWALEWRGDDPRLSQFLRATNYDKLSGLSLLPHHWRTVRVAGRSADVAAPGGNGVRLPSQPSPGA